MSLLVFSGKQRCGGFWDEERREEMMCLCYYPISDRSLALAAITSPLAASPSLSFSLFLFMFISLCSRPIDLAISLELDDV